MGHRLLLGALVAFSLSSAIGCGSFGDGDQPWVAIPDSVDSKVSTLTDNGAADPSTQVAYFDVGLKSKDPNGLTALVNGGVANGNYLTPEQFCDRFGPDPDKMKAAVAHYQSFGLTIHPQVGCQLLSMGGTVAQINAAFHTELRLYTFMDKPTLANSTLLMAPPAFADVVSGVSGIDLLFPPAQPGVMAVPPSVPPVSTSTPPPVATSAVPPTQ